MSSNEKLDLIDVKEHLSYRNNLVQSKGFSNLCKLMKTSKSDLKVHTEVTNVFFDCLFEYGDTPFDLFLQAVAFLQKEEVISKTDVWENYIRRFARIQNTQRAFMTVLELCQPSYKDAISIATKMDSLVLLKAFSEENFRNEQFRYMVVFLFAGVFTDGETLRLLGDNDRFRHIFLDYFPNMCAINKQYDFDSENFLKTCSDKTGTDHSLERLDRFAKLKLMYERPELARNKNIENHITYAPYMFMLNQYRNFFLEALDPNSIEQEILAIRQKTSACFKGDALLIKQIDFKTENFNLEKYVDFIANCRQRINHFITFVEFCKDSLSMFHKPHILAMLALIMFKAEEYHLQDRCIQLICHFCREVPERAYEYSLYFMSLAIKPFIYVGDQLCLKAVKELVVDKYLLAPTVSFLLALTQRPTTAITALNSLSELVKKYPMIVREIPKALESTNEADEIKVFSAKLNLAKECCIATDENNDVLSWISNLLKGDGDRLWETIDVVRELVVNDILDLATVRKQMAKRLDGERDENVVSAHCRLLSLGSRREDDEMTDEEFQDQKKNTIKELFEMTSCGLHMVAGEAWSALGEFEIEDIAETIGHPSNLVMQYSSLHEDRQRGFVEFVRKLIGKEKETYQRPLYTTALVTSEVPPLLGKVDSYKETLMSANKEETWFWSATLPLTASILQLTSPSNKRVQALRLIKSCLLMVPESTSHESMLKLVAGWRIAIREALNVIAESKSNDILWARDQICKEGKECLTEKKEAVDNIMIMLTVLADVIEEKLKTVDSPQHVDEVTQAQKPWLISVFEFVATRLPRDVKQLREQKANPIYQVLTHSNKASLFIAIFCTRLLYRNQSIVEFYGDGKELGLVEDRMFLGLIEGPRTTLTKEEIPDRKMLWITEEAYGADDITSLVFESRYLSIIQEKTQMNAVLVLEKAEDVENFFTTIVSIPRARGLAGQEQNKKVLDKLWNNGTEVIRRQIYEGLADVALISGTSRKRTIVPNSKLPEHSVLRAALTLYEEKHHVGKKALQKMLGCFVDHKRLDGKYLPPLNWPHVLKFAEWSSIAVEDKLPLVKLACEQQIPEILVSFVEHPELRTVLIISEHLSTVVNLLPKSQARELLLEIILMARTEADEEACVKLARALASIQKNMLVRNVLIKQLPKLDRVMEVADVVLTELKEPNEFVGQISKNFSLWLEARNGQKMNIQRICDLYDLETDPMNKEIMLSLISLEARALSMAQRYEKVLDVITASRITRSRNGMMSHFLPIVLALIVSPCKEVDVPICCFGETIEFHRLMDLAKRPFVRAFLEQISSVEKVKPITTFLHNYLVEEKNVYDSWQIDAAIDIFRTLAAVSPVFAATLCNESEEFWSTLLPI